MDLFLSYCRNTKVYQCFSGSGIPFYYSDPEPFAEVTEKMLNDILHDISSERQTHQDVLKTLYRLSDKSVVQSVLELEDQLRNEIIVSDSWSKLIFKERYVSKGVFGEWSGTPITTESIQDILNQYFDIPNDTYAYNLTRVKEAFTVGTMTLEDFEEFNEETTRDLAEYLIEKLST